MLDESTVERDNTTLEGDDVLDRKLRSARTSLAGAA